MTARSGRSAAEDLLPGEGDHPACTERSEGRSGTPPATGFAEGRCAPHIREPPATPIPGLAFKRKRPALAGLQ